MSGETLASFALAYRQFGPIMRDWARIALERPAWGVAKPDDNATQSIRMGDRTIKASWGEWQFGLKSWTWLKPERSPRAADPIGGVAVTQMSADELLVVGDHGRVEFGATPGVNGGMVLRAKEGRFQNVAG